MESHKAHENCSGIAHRKEDDTRSPGIQQTSKNRVFLYSSIDSEFNYTREKIKYFTPLSISK